MLVVFQKILLTDFDSKVLLGSTENFLNENNCHVRGASPKHQNQNGLVERAWGTKDKLDVEKRAEVCNTDTLRKGRSQVLYRLQISAGGISLSVKSRRAMLGGLIL